MIALPDYFNIDYWTMNDADLAAAWRDVDAANLATDYDGTVTERLAFIEDAVLQRIGAPDDASGDDPAWQDRIRAFGAANLTPGVMTGEENNPEPPATDPRPDPRTHPEYWTE